MKQTAKQSWTYVPARLFLDFYAKQHVGLGASWIPPKSIKDIFDIVNKEVTMLDDGSHDTWISIQ
jgi:hypothetical protein